MIGGQCSVTILLLLLKTTSRYLPLIWIIVFPSAVRFFEKQVRDIEHVVFQPENEKLWGSHSSLSHLKICHVDGRLDIFPLGSDGAEVRLIGKKF